jgi:hypothetical protein
VCASVVCVNIPPTQAHGYVSFVVWCVFLCVVFICKTFSIVNNSPHYLSLGGLKQVSSLSSLMSVISNTCMVQFRLVGRVWPFRKVGGFSRQIYIYPNHSFFLVHSHPKEKKERKNSNSYLRRTLTSFTLMLLYVAYDMSYIIIIIITSRCML